jgi:hypothetical protein
MLKRLENNVPFYTFDSDVGRAILAGSNVRLDELATVLTDVEQLFNPDYLDTMPDPILNFLGYIFYGDFWSNLRLRQYRENLIMVSRLSIVTRGTSYCLIRMIKAVTGFIPGIWLESNPFLADFGRADITPVGKTINLFAWLTLPMTVPRNQFVWQEILDVIDFFSPVTTVVKPTFNQFYANISVAGEPIFS